MHKVTRGQGLQHCEQMDINEGKKGKRGTKQEWVNNKLTSTSTGCSNGASGVHCLSRWPSVNMHAIGEKREENNGVRKWRETGRHQLHFRIETAACTYLRMPWWSEGGRRDMIPLY